MLAEVKSTETVGPVLIHIITEKGHGYEPAVSASDKMHGVAKYDILTGKQSKPKATVSWLLPAPVSHTMTRSLACICECGPGCLSLLEAFAGSKWKLSTWSCFLIIRLLQPRHNLSP